MIRITNKEGNGRKKSYDPEVEYRYLGADVWAKKEDEEEDVAYSEELKEKLEDDSEEKPPENTDN